jgi:radical SAM superfamily enzyme YgiQ (UPF0313 family)
VAAMLPPEWEKKLVDLKVTSLKDKDIRWADYVFIGGMSIQKDSAVEVISRCKQLGKKIVAGGPLFTTEYEAFPEVDHLVLGEAEHALPLFLDDLEKGRAKHLYRTEGFPDLTQTPPPLWDLINFRKYATMDIQYSRGCPYHCDFCDVVQLFGHQVRTKTRDQIINELDNLYHRGWRGNVFFVDDNFIGNKKKLKREILPAIIEWMEKRGHPFAFITETSINLSDDEQLMQMLVQAGFDSVFVGIETVNEESLEECHKSQNRNRDLVQCVKKIQQSGLAVHGGFIIGFDSDPPSIFETMTKFIQESSIVNAMVGLLNAPKGTKLYQRLQKEGRLLKEITGSNTDCSINFVPKMDYEKLQTGYRNVLKGIYSPKPYYDRVIKFLRTYRPLTKKSFHFQPSHLIAFLKSIVFIGIIGRERLQYWKLFFWTLFRRPRLFPLAVTLAIYGLHFRKIYQSVP